MENFDYRSILVDSGTIVQCSPLLGRAAPGVVDAGLPWRLPSFSLQLIDEVVDNQVESAELKEELGMMKKRKTWR